MVKAAGRFYEFRSPSAKMSSTGVMYTIFILILVAMCWKPDPKIFIGKNNYIVEVYNVEVIDGNLNWQFYTYHFTAMKQIMGFVSAVFSHLMLWKYLI